MPAGKIALSGGVGPLSYIPYGVSVRSLRRRARPHVPIPSCQEVQGLRRYLRDTFKIYALDCGTAAPTATERRKTLRGIKNSAALLIAEPNLQNAHALLKALESRDSDALSMAYRALTAGGHEPFWQLKRRLRHWSMNSPIDPEAVTAACALASIDVEALVPVSGRFSDPGLALLVATLVPTWESVTGRTAGLVSIDKEGDAKKCPFADWLGEMHGFLGIPRPSTWQVADIVRRMKREKNPTPYGGG